MEKGVWVVLPLEIICMIINNWNEIIDKMDFFKEIVSTNLGIKDIFNFYEERIGSRIAGYYDIYYFFGDDIRFKINR